MHIVYADTSAVVKLYAPEIGSAWMIQMYKQPDVLFVISELTTVEIPAALTRRERQGHISALHRQQALATFDADCTRVFSLETVTSTVFALARDLIERHPLRAYDAVQLATGLMLYASLTDLSGVSYTFRSADNHLNEAASAEGLTVDDPNRHP